MKNIRIDRIGNMLILLSLLTVAIQLSSCGEANDPQPLGQEKIKQILIGPTWKVQEVTVDGTNRTDVYKNLTLKFGDNTLVTTNGSPLWQTSDTWLFKTEDGKIIERGSDGLEMDITVIDAVLSISLTWDKMTYGPGRTMSVSGQHVFLFTK